MTKEVEKSLAYARAHQQAVRIIWLDREAEILSAVDAVALCSDRIAAGRIIAAVAQDKRFGDMLNKLIDGG
ncbi:MAG: hypothetical protein HFF26_02920 [Oscillospiraceae bacterium]|nr:hypothetical protein [Oscillospiraceae bacterium]